MIVFCIIVKLVCTFENCLSAVFVSLEKQTSWNLTVFELRNNESSSHVSLQRSACGCWLFGLGPIFRIVRLVVISLAASLVSTVDYFSSSFTEHAHSRR
jgi:hypothetical protein